MQRKSFLVISILLLCFSLFSKGSITYANGDSKKESSNEDFSYYLIHYNGEEQEIILNENVTLVLKGWGDENHSLVNGNLYNAHSNQLIEIELTLNDKLNELTTFNEVGIFYRVVESESYNVKLVQPVKVDEKAQLVSKNDNGTLIEEVNIIDEFGTIIEEKGYNYFLTDDKNLKALITKDEYDSLNTDVELINETELIHYP